MSLGFLVLAQSVFSPCLPQKLQSIIVQTARKALKVRGHGQTHSRNFCRFKLDIKPRIYNMSI